MTQIDPYQAAEEYESGRKLKKSGTQKQPFSAVTYSLCDIYSMNMHTNFHMR